MKRSPLIFGLLIFGLAITNGCANRQTKETWQCLFNGEDLTGWTVKCKPQDRDKNFWRVEDGTILADSMNSKGHNYVWLMTERGYGNFVLRLKFQAYKDSPGNSGVQIRSWYNDAECWLDGPQIDINPPEPWRTGMMWDETKGVQRWIFPDLPKGKWVDKTMANPDLVFYYSSDEPAWNDMEIVAVGTNVRAYLNGVEVTDLQGDGILNDEAHIKRRVGEHGSIALQIHTGDRLKIRFKDIYIRDLDNQ